MKKLLSVLLVFLLLLTGCRQVPLEEPDDGTTTQQTTEDSTQDSSGDITEDPIDGPRVLFSQQEARFLEDMLKTFPEYYELERKMENYRQGPEDCHLFVYRSKSFAEDPYKDTIDPSQLVEGCLYVYHISLDRCVLLAEHYDPNTYRTTTRDYYYYYASPNEPGTIYRTDYLGENKTLLYESKSGATVTDVGYYGTDTNGKLLICEDEKRIILYDIPTKTSELLLEHTGILICGFSYWSDYDGDKLNHGYKLWWSTGNGLWEVDHITGKPKCAS